MTTEHKVIGGIILLTLVIMVGGILLSNKKGVEEVDRLKKPLMGEEIADLGAVHISEGQSHPEYNSNPPTSGWHYVGLAGPGIKTKIVPDELILHSMEHGAVVVWYRDGLEKEDIDRITETFNSSSGKKIMIERIGLDVPVALTSWRHLLKLETIDLPTIKEFIETNNDRAPEKEPI